MAPERIAWDHQTTVVSEDSELVDVFGLGYTLCQLLTGPPPWGIPECDTNYTPSSPRIGRDDPR